MAWFAWTLEDGISPVLALLFVVTLAYVVASVFDAVRDHPLYDVAAAAYTVLLFAGWYVVTGSESVVLLGLAALSSVGALVEAYNYRHDTSYLRLGGETDDGAEDA